MLRWVTILKDIVERDSLISEKELPYLSIMLTPPDTYGIHHYGIFSHKYHQKGVDKACFRLI